MILHRVLPFTLLFACVEPGDPKVHDTGGTGEAETDDTETGDTETDDTETDDTETGEPADTVTLPVDDDDDGILAEEDCDDADPSIGEGTPWYPDADGDGYGGDADALALCPGESLPAGTWLSTGGDCDDSTAAAAPGLEEICDDGLDNDCDGTSIGCRHEGAIGPDDANATVLPESEDDLAGGDAVGADIDGDGLADLIIGAPLAGGAGAFYVLTGALSGTVGLADADAKVSGETPDAWFGWELAAGDLDDDGYPEVIAGAPLAGQVLAFSGPVLDSLTAGDATALWTGDDLSYVSLAYSEDLTGDGAADLLVGAPYASDGSGAVPGAAWVVAGGSPGGALEDEARVMWGEDQLAGYAVAAVGDVDGDGAADMLIGRKTDGSSGSGATYLVQGPLTGSLALEDADRRWSNSTYVGSVGAVMAGVGDQDGDGLADVALGAPGFTWSSNPFEHQGVVFVLSGVAESSSKLEDNSISTIYGEAYGGCDAGDSVDGGDFDGDGQADLVVGGSCEFASVLYGPLESRVDMFSGGSFTFEVAYRQSAIFVGDMDGEGTDDLFVSSGDREWGYSYSVAGWLSYGAAW